jgi:hypothetical protein
MPSLEFFRAMQYLFWFFEAWSFEFNWKIFWILWKVKQAQPVWAVQSARHLTGGGPPGQTSSPRASEGALSPRPTGRSASTPLPPNRPPCATTVRPRRLIAVFHFAAPTLIPSLSWLKGEAKLFCHRCTLSFWWTAGSDSLIFCDDGWALDHVRGSSGGGAGGTGRYQESIRLFLMVVALSLSQPHRIRFLSLSSIRDPIYSI